MSLVLSVHDSSIDCLCVVGLCLYKPCVQNLEKSEGEYEHHVDFERATLTYYVIGHNLVEDSMKIYIKPDQ